MTWKTASLTAPPASPAAACRTCCSAFSVCNFAQTRQLQQGEPLPRPNASSSQTCRNTRLAKQVILRGTIAGNAAPRDNPKSVVAPCPRGGLHAIEGSPTTRTLWQAGFKRESKTTKHYLPRGRTAAGRHGATAATVFPGKHKLSQASAPKDRWTTPACLTA